MNNTSNEFIDEELEGIIETVEEPFIDDIPYDDFDDYTYDDDEFSTNDYVIITLVETWKEQQEADRDLKARYGKWIIMILALEFIFMSTILICIGAGWLTFDEWVINAFIITTFGQIMGVVYVIVQNLFSSSNQIINIMEKYIK